MAGDRYPKDPLRRSVLAGLMSCTAGVALAGAPTVSLRPMPRDPELRLRADPGAERLIANAGLSGVVSYAVADAETGEFLEVRKPLLGQPPASVAKAVTTLYALDALGAAHRFRTRIVITGKVENRILKGDLVLVGGGDPMLDSDALAALVEQVKEAGIRYVQGQFLVDATVLPRLALIDADQPDHVGYNPAISGLNLNYNRVYFEWKRNGGNYDLTMDARTRNRRPRVGIAQMQVVDRALPVYTYADQQGRDAWTVSKKALGKGGGRWLPVRRPEGYAAEVFHTIAQGSGLSLPRPEPGLAPGDGRVVAVHAGPPLGTVLKGMLKYSTNLTAEVVGLAASAERGAPGATLAESAAAMSAWAAETYGARRAEFVDHSGLGEASRVSAQSMVHILNAVGWDGPLRPMLKPVVLKDGKGRPIKNHPVTAVAKTGTLNFVSALAGYMTGPGGRRLSFAIFSADLPRRARLTQAQRERPEGGRSWAVRSRRLQHRLIERWASSYGA